MIHLPIYFSMQYIDINPFTVNNITIILASKATSAANNLVVCHGEFVQ